MGSPRTTTVCVLVGAVALMAGEAHAGPWARPLGSVYGRAGYGLFRGRAGFLQPTDEAPTTFTSRAWELYLETGLGAHLELDLSVRHVTNLGTVGDGTTFTDMGPEDLELTLKWSPRSALNALGFVVGARQALYERLSADGRPTLRGPGGADLLLGVGYGRSFWPRRAWVVLDLLLRYRLGSPSSAVRLRAEAGVGLLGPVSVVGQVEVQPAYGRTGDVAESAPGPIPTVFSLGAKVLLALGAGVGLALEGVWYPEVLNDGPGYRLGFGLTWERAGGR
ncbi:MAG: hypothetical protein HY909_28755 [Deltaproteobacteria bacterium]|nr:hypothetical protein [Deltaproteobacteria bacterium]